MFPPWSVPGKSQQNKTWSLGKQVRIITNLQMERFFYSHAPSHMNDYQILPDGMSRTKRQNTGFSARNRGIVPSSDMGALT